MLIKLLWILLRIMFMCCHCKDEPLHNSADSVIGHQLVSLETSWFNWADIEHRNCHKTTVSVRKLDWLQHFDELKAIYSSSYDCLKADWYRAHPYLCTTVLSGWSTSHMDIRQVWKKSPNQPHTNDHMFVIYSRQAFRNYHKNKVFLYKK